MAINIARRKFITVLGGARGFVAALCASAAARQRAADRRPDEQCGERSCWADSVAAFRGALTKLGWTEGSNLRIELRWGGADPDRIRTSAKELVDLRPDAILGQTTAVTGALASETRTIPIVFAVVSDPIGSGFATSLAHPGGNITGFTDVDPSNGR